MPEGEKREKGIKNVFEEMMAEKFPNFKKEIDIQVQEVQKVPNKINPNRPTVDYSPQGSSVHGILQARILEWVAISFSKRDPH